MREEERGPPEPDPAYHEPKLQVYVVPKLEDVTLSDPVLQKMLRAVFRRGR